MDPRKLLAEAWSAFQAGRPDLAEAALRKVLAVQPRNLQALIALGTIAASTGDLPTAIDRMREVLKIEPRAEAAVEWLATLYLQTKDLVEAEKYAQRGLKLNPNNIQFLKVLGQCNVQFGDYEAALSFFEAAANLQPDDAQAHFARGTMLRRLHRFSEALPVLREAARLSREAQAQFELADLEASMGMTADCIASCFRALSVEPYAYPANLLMARTLMTQNRLEEAERYWKQAEAEEQMAGQTRLAKAMQLATVGRFDDAEIEANRAIELDPKRGKPYYVIFASRRVTADDQPRIARIESLLSGSDLADSDRVEFLYALGKAYDNLGDYENAIDTFDKANALQRTLVLGDRPFDRDEFSRSVDNQIEMFTKSLLSPIGDAASDLPLFVLGMARSGTTLVDQILSCHPEVGSAGEQSFWLDYEKTVVDYGHKQINADRAQRLREYYIKLLSSLAPGFTQVIDKNPANLMVAGLLHTQFTSSRIVCTRRHAADTALSIWTTQMHTQAPFVCDRSNIVFAYKEYLRLMDHWRDAMPPSRYMEVSYESLINDPEQQIRALLDFCGLEWSEECLHPERNARSISTPSFWQVRQPLYRTSVDRWKKYERWLGPFEELINL